MNIKDILENGKFSISPDGYWEACQWLKQKDLWDKTLEESKDHQIMIINFANLAFLTSKIQSNLEAVYNFNTHVVKKFKEFFLDANLYKTEIEKVQYKVCNNGVELIILDTKDVNGNSNKSFH